MKVVCKNNFFGKYYLTIGKEYKILKNRGNYYSIVNDSGYINEYDSDCFLSVKEYRKQKLEKINENIL
jgi:hypothetical protein